jgi:hypothetical protein
MVSMLTVSLMSGVKSKGSALISADNLAPTCQNQRDRYVGKQKLMDVIGQIIKTAKDNWRNTSLIAEDLSAVETDAVTMSRKYSKQGVQCQILYLDGSIK